MARVHIGFELSESLVVGLRVFVHFHVVVLVEGDFRFGADIGVDGIVLVDLVREGSVRFSFYLADIVRVSSRWCLQAIQSIVVLPTEAMSAGRARPAGTAMLSFTDSASVAKPATSQGSVILRESRKQITKSWVLNSEKADFSLVLNLGRMPSTCE